MSSVAEEMRHILLYISQLSNLIDILISMVMNYNTCSNLLHFDKGVKSNIIQLGYILAKATLLHIGRGGCVVKCI